MKFKESPLGSGFFVVSIIGILVSIIYIWPFSPSFGFAFLILFVAAFIASIHSMIRANPSAQLNMKPLHASSKMTKKTSKRKSTKKRSTRKSSKRKSTKKKSSKKRH